VNCLPWFAAPIAASLVSAIAFASYMRNYYCFVVVCVFLSFLFSSHKPVLELGWGWWEDCEAEHFALKRNRETTGYSDV